MLVSRSHFSTDNKGPGEDAFSPATETVEGSCGDGNYAMTPCVLQACVGFAAAKNPALCNVNYKAKGGGGGGGGGAVPDGTDVHLNPEDGHVYAVGVSVRRWLPAARKWSLPVAETGAGGGNRGRFFAGSAVFFVGRKMKEGYDTKGDPFAAAQQGLRDGFASIVRIGAAAGAMGAEAALGRPAVDLRCRVPTQAFSPDGRTLYAVMRSVRPLATDRLVVAFSFFYLLTHPTPPLLVVSHHSLLYLFVMCMCIAGAQARRPL